MWRGVLDTTLHDKVCKWFATGRWVSPGIPVSSINTTDRHDVTEILFKVAVNTIKTKSKNKGYFARKSKKLLPATKPK